MSIPSIIAKTIMSVILFFVGFILAFQMNKGDKESRTISFIMAIIMFMSIGAMWV